jgi:hypothetical protein
MNGYDILNSYYNLYNEFKGASKEDLTHFINMFDKWLDEICTCLRSGKSLKGLISLSSDNYIGKKTRALMDLLDIKNIRTLSSLEQVLYAKYDLMRVRVDIKDSDKCPYCGYHMKPEEGTSEMGKDGRCTIWCISCGESYYYFDKSCAVNGNELTEEMLVKMLSDMNINGLTSRNFTVEEGNGVFIIRDSEMVITVSKDYRVKDVVITGGGDDHKKQVEKWRDVFQVSLDCLNERGFIDISKVLPIARQLVTSSGNHTVMHGYIILNGDGKLGWDNNTEFHPDKDTAYRRVADFTRNVGNVDIRLVVRSAMLIYKLPDQKGD